jgi:hypothetical protein
MLPMVNYNSSFGLTPSSGELQEPTTAATRHPTY